MCDEKIREYFNLKNKNTEFLRGLNLLDIGCGGGLISEPMSRLGATVTGIDASEKNINIEFNTINVSDYGQSGDPKDLYSRYNLDQKSIEKKLKKLLNE